MPRGRPCNINGCVCSGPSVLSLMISNKPITLMRTGVRGITRSYRCFGFVVALFVFLLAINPVSAEIYKWVDESGNVHFGDKPKDAATLQSSKKVELESSYVPGESLTPGQLEAQKAFLRRKDHERERRKAEAEKQAVKNKELQAQCKLMRERLADFTNMGMRDGVRTGVDYFVEDGKSVSAKRQQEILAGLQEKVSKKCD